MGGQCLAGWSLRGWTEKIEKLHGNKTVESQLEKGSRRMRSMSNSREAKLDLKLDVDIVR